MGSLRRELRVMKLDVGWAAHGLVLVSLAHRDETDDESPRV
jgi:hypothetical protein